MQITKQLHFPTIPWLVVINGLSSSSEQYVVDVQVVLPGLGVCTVHSWQSYNPIVPGMSVNNFQNRIDNFAAQVQEWTPEELCANIIYALECGHYRNRNVENESAIKSGIQDVIGNILSNDVEMVG